MKKGAMFGLDARIALAIFGALSVISGAALYSAIENSRVTSFLVSMEEISKAIDEYFINTGSLPLALNKSGTWMGVTSELGKIIQDTAAGWNGPYLPVEYNNSSTISVSEHDFTLSLHGNRSSSLLANSMACSSAYGYCDLFLSRSFNNTETAQAYNLFHALDKAVDNSDGINKGRIHAVQSSNNTTTLDTTNLITILYKLKPCGYGLCY
jgi:type II secretory pathway pseudopilin PulG